MTEGKDLYTSAASWFGQGLLVHLTKPKVIVFWISIAAVAIQPEASLWVSTTLICDAGLSSMNNIGSYALLFSHPMF